MAIEAPKIVEVNATNEQQPLQLTQVAKRDFSKAIVSLDSYIKQINEQAVKSFEEKKPSIAQGLRLSDEGREFISKEKGVILNNMADKINQALKDIYVQPKDSSDQYFLVENLKKGLPVETIKSDIVNGMNDRIGSALASPLAPKALGQFERNQTGLTDQEALSQLNDLVAFARAGQMKPKYKNEIDLMSAITSGFAVTPEFEKDLIKDAYNKWGSSIQIWKNEK